MINNPASYPPDSSRFEDDSIDYKRYLSLFLSNWYWFAGALFISLSIAYGINRWSEEIYTVSSTLLIKESQFGQGSTDIYSIFPGTNAFKSEQNLKNEIGILKSFTLNYRVMRSLPDFHVAYVNVGRRGIAETRMYKNLPFMVIYDSLEKQVTGTRVKIRILSEDSYRLEIDGKNGFERNMTFGERFNERGFDFTIIKNGKYFYYDPEASNRYYFYFLSPYALAKSYRSRLNVTPVEEEATLVTLSVSGPVPEQEADYLNKLMDEYLQQGLDVKNQTAEKTIEFIDGQISLIADSLRQVENALENFKLTNRLIDLSREGSLIQNRLEAYEKERSTLVLQKKYYEYLQEYISSRNETGDIVSPGAMGVTNASLERLVTELATLQQQKSRLKMNISENLPAISVLDNSIMDARALISENIKNSLLNLENAIKESDRLIAEVESELSKLPGTERTLINIQRKFELNNTVYNYLLEKRAEAGIAKASNVSDNRIVDYAGSYNAARISPKKRQNMAMAIALGLMIPALMILLIDYLNNKVIDRKDIEKKTRAPVIGYISHNKSGMDLPIIEHPGSTLAESFRSVRTNLRYFVKDITCPVISVTSTITAEGKTFIAANLASIIAIGGKKVLLTELDLRKPRVHKIFGIDGDTGLSTYLAGEEKFENVIFRMQTENLWYTPSGPLPPNPAELIDSQGMKDFIEKARKQFDYIVIDTPPVAVVTDALLISSFTDIYLFVVRQRYSFKNTIDLVEELRQSGKMKNTAIILNDISLTGYYGYGLRYGYVAGYGYSYGYNYYGSYNYSRYGYSDREKEYYTEEK
ncbi:MAG: GumC family protein [Bacteroidales bacterium]